VPVVKASNTYLGTFVFLSPLLDRGVMLQRPVGAGVEASRGRVGWVWEEDLRESIRAETREKEGRKQGRGTRLRVCLFWPSAFW